MMRYGWLLLAAACGLWGAAKPKPARQAAETWYMRETAMSEDGRLTFTGKSWWPRAQALAEGASFEMDLNGDGRPDTLVKRENGNLVEVIDDSGKAPRIEGRASTAYVVSLKGTGLVDRMVVYIDNDGDGIAEEWEFRHYQDGYLRYCWFAETYDKSPPDVFQLKNWSYGGTDSPDNRFRGNLIIYLNKYDPATKRWLPLSECPFTFWDYDHDGRSDAVLRVSAAPLDSNRGPDADYANNYNYMWAPEATPLERTGNMNVRLSFNVDAPPRGEPVNKPHFNFGFTVVGAEPYRYPGMEYTNPRRRAPQTVIRVPWKDGVKPGVNYPGSETGFTWNEDHDVWRWEGQFWIYDRIYLPNTGGPTRRWNMRREYSGKPAAARRIYYSEIDRRYHLLGAADGWMEAGYLVNQQKDLEFQYFDTDQDGYFDTFKVFEPGKPEPARVTRVRDPRAKEVPLTREFLIEDYNARVLPRAIAENRKLIAALKGVAKAPLAEAYEADAEKTGYLERRRYALDVARELYFLAARAALYGKLAAGPYPRLDRVERGKPKGLALGPGEGFYTLGDSVRYWVAAKKLQAFEQQYGEGRLAEALGTFEEIAAALRR